MAVEYPAIARFTIDELEGEMLAVTEQAVAEVPDEAEGDDGAAPAFATVGDVLAWARSEIARLSGMSPDAIKLDLKIEA